MYNVAISVQACLRAGTGVDVAWVIDPGSFGREIEQHAVAYTPGGGRIGQLIGGAADASLQEIAQRGLSSGRIVAVTVSDVDAAVAGLAHGGELRCAIVPGTQLPDSLWPALIAREPVCLVADLADTAVTNVRHYGADTIDQAPNVAREEFSHAHTSSRFDNKHLVTVLQPVPQLAVFGAGPIADALRSAAGLLGWQIVVESDVSAAVGHMALLAPIDHAVVIGHDVESTSRVLAAALESDAGYIGAVGSIAMQKNRADWLAYRGITDLSRVHGPAGFDIGAGNPAEVAVSILAEAIAATARRD